MPRYNNKKIHVVRDELKHLCGDFSDLSLEEKLRDEEQALSSAMRTELATYFSETAQWEAELERERIDEARKHELEETQARTQYYSFCGAGSFSDDEYDADNEEEEEEEEEEFLSPYDLAKSRPRAVLFNKQRHPRECRIKKTNDYVDGGNKRGMHQKRK